MIVSAIISLFTLSLYTALGVYVLTKNPRERTNQIFALLMLAFIIWELGVYNIGLITDNVPRREVILHIKLQLSGIILALTAFVFFVLYLTKADKILKNPLIYLLIAPSIYMLYLIWTSETPNMELETFPSMAITKLELLLFSTIFGVAGIYLLLKYYMTSKYREHKQAKLMLTGAIAAVLVAITTNIILPMFFDIYLFELSTLAPAVMGVFFAYAIYHYGLFVAPMPELSVTSFCGADCTLCSDYLSNNCPGCRFDRERYKNCEVYKCVIERNFSDCSDCLEIITCLERNKNYRLCFISKPKYDLKYGHTYLVEGNGYTLFLDAVKQGACGLVATITQPQQIKEKYGLNTTPIVWISDEPIDRGVRPNNPMRLGLILMNFMKEIGNSVILLDGIDILIKINGIDNVLRIVRILKNAAQTTNSRLIIPTEIGGENLSRLRQNMEYITLKNH